MCKLRIAKVDDFGEVLKDSEIMDNYDLYDDRQIYF